MPTVPTPIELQDGRYTLLRPLGEGAQGETFEARDNGAATEQRRRVAEALSDRWDRYVAQARAAESMGARGTDAPAPVRGNVAIKRFRVDKAKAWKDVELAEREAKTLASLDHAKLPKYIEHFEEAGALYLVMEKVEGESLATIRSRRLTLDVAEVIRMLEDIAEALRYLHGRSPSIVHRDVKPGNILRRPDGSYALVDFGSVRDRLKPKGGSTVVGTFGYMAPEQFQGRASPKSDLYGLGATAMTMLTGCEPEELPHEGLGIAVARALPRGTPAPLVRTLAAMLEPDPDRRVDSIDDTLALLRSREEKRAQRPPSRARRAPLVVRVMGKLALFVAWLVVWLTVGLLVPTLLGLLSLVFGAALRRAARACVRASTRSHIAFGRASSWLSGHHAEVAQNERVRIASDVDGARAASHAEPRRVSAKPWADELAEEAERPEIAEERARSAKRRA